MDSRKIIGIYLAAGSSSRMGENKLNLPFQSTYLGSMALESAFRSHLSHTIVVIRKNHPLDWLNPYSAMDGWSCLDSVDAENGQSASLKLGVKAAKEMKADGVIVLLGDQPFVTTEMIDHLITEYHECPSQHFVTFSQNGIPKPPTLISADLFPSVMELSGDQGARRLIREEKHIGKSIELANDLPFYDIDKKEDYLFLQTFKS